MKLAKHHIELLLLFALLLIGMSMYLIPVNDMPFGDVDAATHFGIGDYAGTTNMPVETLPPYLDRAKGHVNNHKIWYPPQYHHNIALLQIISGERIIGPYLLIAFEGMLIGTAVFLLIRHLFGMWAGFLAGILSLFSMRDINVYLWSQWPQQISYFYLPVILYTAYRYLTSAFEGKPKLVYLYLTALLCVFQYFQHPQGLLHSAAALGIFSLVMIIKERKMPFDWIHIAVAGVIFLVLFLPTLKYTGELSEQQAGIKLGLSNVGGFFSWFIPQDNFHGTPETYFSFKDMYGYWLIPFILLGVVFLFMKRDTKHLLMLSWMLSLYILFHLKLFGILDYRTHRMLAAESHLFYPLIVLGIMFLITFISSLVSAERRVVTGIIILLFAGMFWVWNAQPALARLQSANDPLSRVNPAEYDAMNYLQMNIPEDAVYLSAGTAVYPVKKWMYILAQRSAAYDSNLIGTEHEFANLSSYVVVDYSQLVMLGRQDVAQQLIGWEQQTLQNDTLLYNQENIRVYKLER
ncbi:hypothetical protein J4460_02095 [Candidatus Woesearchaeota archaeon]|nr:MAG: hypothetical protein QS99_C0007G0035 [archaeon GW2011_AR4]MBS3129443.1 hypothetical protein [Candidatus Woesearchaeota archaeon]HIH38484.1 hypothetical protein [Candidatus Woesearchaeota archaeon]HIH49776.1 hypothetical protein [Candidatus Woesearchaeota archaeon]HIJ03497.1 hypothetical protein [Candidatus Woesearchaeota archaeon]